MQPNIATYHDPYTRIDWDEILIFELAQIICCPNQHVQHI